MKVQMTNEQIKGYIDVLVQLKDEKGKLGFAIAKNRRKMLTEAEEFLEMCEVDITTVTPDELCSGNLTSQQMFDLDWMVDQQ